MKKLFLFSIAVLLAWQNGFGQTDRKKNEKFFSDRFSGDSSFFHNPDMKDLPSGQFFMNRERMEKMFRELDSLHNEFYKKHFSYPLQPGEENEPNS